MARLLAVLGGLAAFGANAQLGGARPADLQAPMELASRDRTSVVGARKPVNRETPGVKLAAAQAAAQWNVQSNAARRYDVLRVLDGTQQVVSGLKYELTLELAETACAKATPAEQACDRAPSGRTSLVRATVWTRSWLPAESRHQVSLEALTPPEEGEEAGAGAEGGEAQEQQQEEQEQEEQAQADGEAAPGGAEDSGDEEQEGEGEGDEEGGRPEPAGEDEGEEEDAEQQGGGDEGVEAPQEQEPDEQEPEAAAEGADGAEEEQGAAEEEEENPDA